MVTNDEHWNIPLSELKRLVDEAWEYRPEGDVTVWRLDRGTLDVQYSDGTAGWFMREDHDGCL